MEKRKRNNGAPILIMSAVIMAVYLPKVDFNNLRTVDIVLLVSIGVFFSCGVYVFVKSLRRDTADKTEV
jgi:hypothetical protein